MARSTSLPAFFFAALCLGLTIFLFNVADEQQHRNILLIVMMVEGVALSWLIWNLAQPPEVQEAPAIPLPRSRPLEIIPAVPVATPKPRPQYQHRPLQPSRPPARSSNPLPSLPPIPRRTPTLPAIPELPEPQPGRSHNRAPEAAPRPSTPRPQGQPIRLGDLLPPAPSPSSNPAPVAPPPPRPEIVPTAQGRPKRPRKYASFSGDSSELPAKISLGEMQLCCDILCLGYACAASDGPVSTEEDEHLQGWLWCVVENTSDRDAATIHQAMAQTAEQCKTRGKLKLEAVTKLGEAIRSTGEKKLIQAAAELCGEIVAHDGRLEPGELATLSHALNALGTKSVKASKIAKELLGDDEEIKEMLAELGIHGRTSTEERERKLSVAWSKENARMQAITDADRRETMRLRMELIQRIRDLYRELDQHG